MNKQKEDLNGQEDLAEREDYHMACFPAQQVDEKAFIYAQARI